MTIQKLEIQGHYLDLLLRPGYVARIATKGFQVHVPPIGTKVQETGWRETPSSTRVGEIVLDGSEVEIARDDPNAVLRSAVRKLRLTSVSKKTAISYDIAYRNPG